MPGMISQTSPDFVYPYSTQFISRLRTIQKNRRPDPTSKSHDVIQSRADLSAAMSFSTNYHKPLSTGVVISAPMVSDAKTRALSRGRSRSRSRSRSNSVDSSRQSQCGWRGRRRSRSGDSVRSTGGQSVSSLGFGSSAASQRLVIPWEDHGGQSRGRSRSGGSSRERVRSQSRERTASQGPSHSLPTGGSVSSRSGNTSISRTNPRYPHRRRSSSGHVGASGGSTPMGFGSSTQTRRTPPPDAEDNGGDRGRSRHRDRDWTPSAAVLGSTSSSRNKARKKGQSKERERDATRSQGPGHNQVHNDGFGDSPDDRRHSPPHQSLKHPLQQWINPHYTPQSQSQSPPQSTADFILHQPSHRHTRTHYDHVDDHGDDDDDDDAAKGYFSRHVDRNGNNNRWSREGVAAGLTRRESDPNGPSPVTYGGDRGGYEDAYFGRLQQEQQEQEARRPVIENTSDQQRDSTPPSGTSSSEYFLDLSGILAPPARQSESPSQEYGDDEAALLEDLARLDVKAGKGTRQYNMIPPLDTQIDSAMGGSGGDVDSDPPVEGQILVLSCRYTLIRHEAQDTNPSWTGGGLLVVRTSSTLAEVVRAVRRQFQPLPEPDFDLIVTTPTGPPQEFRSVLRTLAGRLQADELVPLPHLREDCLITIRPSTEYPPQQYQFHDHEQQHDERHQEQEQDYQDSRHHYRHRHGDRHRHDDRHHHDDRQQHEQELLPHRDESPHGYHQHHHQPEQQPRSFSDTASDLSQEDFGEDHPAGTASFYDLYELGDVLGKGSFSTVHRAVHLETGATVAVKCMVLDDMSADEQQQLYHEVDILRSIQHPHVLEFYGFFMEERGDTQSAGHDLHTYQQKKMYFLVTELLEGGELFQRIVQKTSYSELDARDVIFTLLSTVAFLHANSIVHRDLKPENLLLTDSDEADDRRIKIADFGLAEVTDGYVSLQTPCGTPGYAAPEIMSNKQYGKACDMWSIGVILYVLLGGYPPFDADRYVASIQRPVEFHPDPWDNISDDAQDLIRRLLVVEPLERLTAEEALQHRWLARPEGSFSGNLLKAALANLKRYHRLRKFKGATKAVIAARRMSALVNTPFVTPATEPELEPNPEPERAHHSSGGGSYSHGQQQSRQRSSQQRATKKYNNVYASQSPQHHAQVSSDEVRDRHTDNLLAVLDQSERSARDLTVEDLGSVMSGGQEDNEKAGGHWEFRSPPESEDEGERSGGRRGGRTARRKHREKQRTQMPHQDYSQSQKQDPYKQPQDNHYGGQYDHRVYRSRYQQELDRTAYAI